MTADVARNFTAARRKADQNRIVQIERLDQRGQVVRVGIHIVSVPRLAGSAMTAAVVGNAAITVRRHEEHLPFPAVGIERPPVTEDNWLSSSPVLVVNLRAVFRRHQAHLAPSSDPCPRSFCFAWF